MSIVMADHFLIAVCVACFASGAALMSWYLDRR
jgi:hypothetical protein